MSDKELENRGYFAHVENGKKIRRSPRGVRVDIFTEDVSGIAISIIAKTAQTKTFKGDRAIRIICLEALLLAKLRASRQSRPQDFNDIQELISYKRKKSIGKSSKS
jgi:hypothetical protein